MNKSLENQNLNVLVENLTEDKTQVFGRSEYMTSVYLMVIKVILERLFKLKLNKVIRSTLFGEKINNTNQKVA